MLVERLLKIALLGSEWVLYLLLALSVLSIATMVDRLWYFRKRSEDLGKLRSALLARLSDGDIAGGRALLEKSPSVQAKVTLAALEWAERGPDVMIDVGDAELARQRKQMESGLNLLGTLGNNAPFIGLFGTVLGVIIAFHALGSAGQNTGAMGQVMAGIAEALVATGVGIFVAIPAVVAYNLIQKRIGDIESESMALVKLCSAFVKSLPTFGEEIVEDGAPLVEKERHSGKLALTPSVLEGADDEASDADARAYSN
ncbi:MAG: MotA/TolQ/ExbB proton channel family protein [Polyangiaceae bacterium]|nr:MotA/TolQ/ExbB proton channel family protein [Polyangiaceae bacterium]